MCLPDLQSLLYWEEPLLSNYMFAPRLFYKFVKLPWPIEITNLADQHQQSTELTLPMYILYILMGMYHFVCVFSLQWCHNDNDGVSNHQPHGCLLNRLFRRRSKKTSKLHVTGLCVGNSPGPVSSPHKGPVTRKMFPFDDVIMTCFWKQASV